MSVPGIGPIISSVMVVVIGAGDVFTKAATLPPWLGLVPKQISTADRTILGKISRRGPPASSVHCTHLLFRTRNEVPNTSGPTRRLSLASIARCSSLDGMKTSGIATARKMKEHIQSDQAENLAKILSLHTRTSSQSSSCIARLRSSRDGAGLLLRADLRGWPRDLIG